MIERNLGTTTYQVAADALEGGHVFRWYVVAENWLGFVREESYFTTACIGDFNLSGGTPDDTDASDFFTAWNSGSSSADVNGSGGTPDDTDVSVFFSHWNEGC